MLAVADMAVDVATSRCWCCAPRIAKTRWRSVTIECPSQSWHDRGAQRVIDRAVQLFGGQGVMAGNVVERLYREIRALRIYEGTSEIQKLVIARSFLR